MVALLCFFLALLASPFKSNCRFEAETAALRHQLMVLQRKVRGRVHFTNSDRLSLSSYIVGFPSALGAMTMIRPETVVRWHRAGVRRYWRWKSRWSRSAICFRNVHPTNRRWKVAPKPLQAAAVKSGPRGRDGGVCQELAAGMIRDLVLQKWHRRSNFRNRAVVERAGVHYRPIVSLPKTPSV
jgi:hypothetical protein